ncbi:polysaccharide lyase 8 family protein [Chitinophaga barathri]|uniref:Chondroitinase n=1 Tax=Chitinophaga barathri TaxID=1647451 RepID=A0A3N4MLX8_9BACT|nr:polysaccharide lyase 8 family protein [Chitinophaga barathri]RPD42997.1 hypothetical protein EG028_01525 [Chitinophaga barathri]
MGKIVLAASLMICLCFSTAKADEFDDLRLKWCNYLIGGTQVDLKDPVAKSLIDKIAAQAKADWAALDKSGDRCFLWKENADPFRSSNLDRQFLKIKNMALAYSVQGSAFYGNKAMLKDAISAFNWMYENRYNERIYPFFNWWHFEIGSPLIINDILVLLYDHLTKEQVNNFIRASRWYSPNVDGKGVQYFEAYKYVGANRVWRCQVIGLRGVIAKDTAEMVHARDQLSPVFEYVKTNDGFYTDGSFVQHGRFAYTGGYGKSLLKNISYYLYLVKGSTWDVKDPRQANFYRWIYYSFEPVIYKGAMMDMVRAREIAREQLQDHAAGAEAIESLLFAAQFAPPADALNYKRMIRQWIKSDFYHNFYDGLSLYSLKLTKDLMENDQIKEKPELLGNWQFANMDRVVHRRPGYALGISMYSDRIWNYELHKKSKENLKAWYTGYGMTYLYNNDLSQYSEDFWPTVDAYRLPGITVVRKLKQPGEGSYTLGANWVGGAKLSGLYGVTGMQIDDTTLMLRAKKSWFMFDDEIVALGTDISGPGSDSLETIVENRKLTKSGIQPLYVDGRSISNSGDWKQIFKNPGWMHLKGPVPNSDIGYFFPERQNVHAKRESRSGSWNDLKPGRPDSVKREYLTLWFSHDPEPGDHSYSYVLLPGKSTAQLGRYAKNPDIEIIENSKFAQAVREKKTGLTGINFWADAAQKVGIVTSHHKAALMLKRLPGQLEISVCDPTHSNRDVILLEFDVAAKNILTADSRVRVQQLSPTLKIAVDVKDAAGASIGAVFSIEN